MGKGGGVLGANVFKNIRIFTCPPSFCIKVQAILIMAGENIVGFGLVEAVTMKSVVLWLVQSEDGFCPNCMYRSWVTFFLCTFIKDIHATGT
jgi:hypothetical protein